MGVQGSQPSVHNHLSTLLGTVSHGYHSKCILNGHSHVVRSNALSEWSTSNRPMSHAYTLHAMHRRTWELLYIA